MSDQLRTWLGQWAWGSASASDVVRNARAFVRDAHRDPLIARLATSGGDLRNAERVVRSILPESTCDITPLVDSRVQEVLLPTHTMRWLQRLNPREFRLRFGAVPGDIERWWQSLKRTPIGADFWATHPFLRRKRPEDLRRHLPLVLHEDAGLVSKHHKRLYTELPLFVGRWGRD